MRQLVARDTAAQLTGAGIRVVHRYATTVLADADATVGEPVDDPHIFVHGVSVAVPSDVFRRGDGPRVLARFAGPVAASWVSRLAAAGVTVAFWCPPFGACLDVPKRVRLDGFPWLVGFQPYAEENCARRLAASSVPGADREFVDVVCFSRPDRARVERRLRHAGVAVVDRGTTKLRISARTDVAGVRDLVGVKVVDPGRPARLLRVGVLTVDADRLAGTLDMAAGGNWLAGADGAGEVLAVADTGLDAGVPDGSLHRDFAGRVRRLVSWPINPSWSSVVANPGADDGPADVNSGHGTYVAGLAVGDGALSGGRHRGVAPAAGLVFQAIEQWVQVSPDNASLGQPGYYLAGRPLDLRELFAGAAAAGARIHVNAWGDPARGGYTNDSYETDLWLHENPDHVVLFAAGNSGSDADGDREIDPGSLDAPATAKNVLTVGATEGPVYGVGFLGAWSALQGGGRSFASSADRTDGVSGNPDRMALVSSAGPTADGRTKPDVCAPGTNLAAPRSSRIAGRGWGYADPAPAYMYDGGTSAAVGVAGGFVAVLRQQWRRVRRGRPPRGATLKALCVAGAVPVTNRAGSGPELRRVAGFGRLALAASLPEGPGHRIHVLRDGGHGLVTGTRRTFRLTLRSAGPLRVVLAWYDAPGERLVNDLDLTVVDPAGRRWHGNHPDGAVGTADRANTVEVVDLPTAEPGPYVVTVDAFNVPAGPQPFSLVARGPRDLAAATTTANRPSKPDNNP